MDFCFMGDSHFTANLFEDFPVKIIPPINLESFTHAIKLDAMGNLMFQHKRKESEVCQDFC